MPGVPPLITVDRATDVTDELVAAVARLVGQLSSSASPPTRQELDAIVASPATTLLLARAGEPDGEIVGMLTVATFRIPTGVRAWVEDVVVDAAARGRGVGEALSRRAIEVAEAEGAKTVDLTSRPSREAANRLYQRIGFQPRETNVYRYERPPADPGPNRR